MSYGIIAAVSRDWAIGLDGGIPWHYSADLKRLKRLTTATTIIMGRHTWEALPKRPLPNRRNIVITSRTLTGVEHYPSIEAALARCRGDVWFFGGARIYEQAMPLADVIDLTMVPETVPEQRAVRFPNIDPTVWMLEVSEPLPEDTRLEHRRYVRRPHA